MAYSPWGLKESDMTELARITQLRLPQVQSSKESPCNAGDMGSIPGLGRFPWRRKWQPTPVFLPGKSLGQRSLVGYRPWGHKRVGYNLATKQQQDLLRACYVPVTVSKCFPRMNEFMPHKPILQLRNAEAQGHLTADLY